MRRWLLVALQLSVTAGLLVFFFHRAEFREQALAAIRSAHPGWIVLGIVFAGVENLIGVFRWRIFLRMLAIDLSVSKSIQICLVALFCNTFMLGAVGGDLVRAAYLMRRGNSKIDSLLSVMMDRLSGLVALTVFTVALTAGHFAWLSSSPTVVVMLKFVFAFQLLSMALIAATLVVAARGWTERLPRWAPCKEFVRRMGSGYARLASQWPASLRAVGLSFLMLAAFFAVFYAGSAAFTLPLTYLQMSTLMPIADVISALPISVGGLGVREQVFVVLLGSLASIPAATAVSVSLAGYLMNNSWGLVGALLLPLFKGIVRDARQAA